MKKVTGHIHVLVTDNNLLTIHTQSIIREGDTLDIYGKPVPVRSIKAADSNYYKGFSFYEVNFKKDRAV
jgi:hypothetical protein